MSHLPASLMNRFNQTESTEFPTDPLFRLFYRPEEFYLTFYILFHNTILNDF